jgi:hypothetical protein
MVADRDAQALWFSENEMHCASMSWFFLLELLEVIDFRKVFQLAFDIVGQG